MTETNWRRDCVELLAIEPTEWQRLSELFAIVESSIPMHIAMRRHIAQKSQTEIGVHTARWRLFLTHVNTLVERRSSDGTPLAHRALRTDFVRLLPHAVPCTDCGGPRFLKEWPQRGMPRKYFCPNCAKPIVSIPEPVPVPVSELAPLVTLAPAPIVVTLALKEEPAPKKLNAYQRRGRKPRPVTNSLPKPLPKRAILHLPKPPKQVALPVELPPPPPKMTVDSKRSVSVDLGSNQTAIFNNCRTLAQNVKAFLGFGSINEIEREIMTTKSLSTVLTKRGRTMVEFIARINFNMLMNKAKEH